MATDDVRSDRELIRSAQQGDADAYGVLVRRYQRDVLRAAFAIAGAALAEDVAQEAFVRGFRFIHRFRIDAPLRPWLLAIVANVARNQQRAASRWVRAGERIIERDLGTSPEAHAIDRRRRDDLWKALDALPSRLRDVVVCRYLLDLSEAETADGLGLARGTVKSRLSRALGRLEQTLPAEVLDD